MPEALRSRYAITEAERQEQQQVGKAEAVRWLDVAPKLGGADAGACAWLCLEHLADSCGWRSAACRAFVEELALQALYGPEVAPPAPKKKAAAKQKPRPPSSPGVMADSVADRQSTGPESKQRRGP